MTTLVTSVAGFIGTNFVLLSESADVLWKTTDYSSPAHERCLTWNDPATDIIWPKGFTKQLSAKAKAGKVLSEAEVFA